MKKFANSKYNSLGIVCKTQQQANKLYEAVNNEFDVNLLNATSVVFGNGIVITTAHLAKGLEFDSVIVPFVHHKNYITEPDRQMLYVACTRAMHCLYLTCNGKISGFLN